MHLTLTTTDGDRDVRLMDLYALRRGSVISDTLGLLADFEEAQEAAQESVEILQKQKDRGEISQTRMGAEVHALNTRLDRRRIGIFGFMLAQLLHAPPVVPVGDLTPYEHGYLVAEGLIANGWTAQEIDAAATAIFEDGPAASAEEARERQVKARVQRGLDFSRPQPES